MRALVINCSAPHYNLGARKLHDWLQSRDYTVTYYDGDPGIWGLDADLMCLSVIFSWHAPRARDIALRMKDHAEIWCGGPGIFALGACCQFVLPLNWLGDPAKVKLRFDWQSYQQGRDFCRYFNTYGWRSYSIWDYEPRKQEPKPFVLLKSMEVLS